MKLRLRLFLLMWRWPARTVRAMVVNGRLKWRQNRVRSLLSVAIWTGITVLITTMAEPHMRPLVFGGVTAITFWYYADAAWRQFAEPFSGTVHHRTERLEIRPMHRDDVNAYVASMDDHFVTTNGWTPQVRERAIWMIRMRDDLVREDKLVACYRQSGRTAAFVQLVDHPRAGQPRRSRNWVLAAWPASANESPGVRCEALEAALHIVFRSGSETAYTLADADDHDDLDVAESAGGVVLDSFPHELHDGRTITLIWYQFSANAGSLDEPS